MLLFLLPTPSDERSEVMDSRYETHLTHDLDLHSRVLTYLNILASVALAQHEEGILPDLEPHRRLKDLAQKIMHRRGDEDFLADWKKREDIVHHDIAAFVDTVRQYLPDVAPYIYLGMTSSDLVDTADAHLYRRCLASFEQGVRNLKSLLETAIERIPDDARYRRGRTHGQLAEPVATGRLYRRAIRDLGIPDLKVNLPGKLSGPVGEYNSALTPEVETRVFKQWSMWFDNCATQTTDRANYAARAMDLIQIVGVCEQLAVLHRMSSISGVDLFAEAFEPEQKGSSVMAYKRNPIKSERICGLARVCRGHLSTILETSYSQWWERDLTNSSVERTAFWDLVQLTHFILLETIAVVRKGVWTPDPAYDPEYASPVEILIKAQLAGQDPEAAYRNIQLHQQAHDKIVELTECGSEGPPQNAVDEHLCKCSKLRGHDEQDIEPNDPEWPFRYVHRCGTCGSLWMNRRWGND